MPEPPDFDQIAREIDGLVTEYARTTLDLPNPVPAIGEQLRLIWNARGAADIAYLRDAGFAFERALQMLDR